MVFQTDIEEGVTLSKKKSNFYLNPIFEDTVELWSLELWIPKVEDDSLYLKYKDRNEHNNYLVAVMIGGQTSP